MPCNWKLLSGSPVPANIGTIAEDLGITRVIAEVLWRRGFTSPVDMDRFLSPGLRHLAKPETIPGLEQAAEVLARELVGGARLCVWGDYDVDGITSTALVKDFFSKRLGPEIAAHQVRHYLPNRVDDGYGLNSAGIEKLAADGVRLLLTVDCGISAVAEVVRANELGMTVVVSDHHLPPGELPPAAAICNPRLCQGDKGVLGGYSGGCGGACTGMCELAGVGVAFMLLAALNRLLPGAPVDMRQFLDLVALGTVADVVGLTGQNRILVKNGLLLIKEAKRPGIASLKVYSGYDRLAELGAGQIGFGLAPRINAAGRMADPQIALDMLLAPDMDTANPLASKLDGLNAKRRSEEQAILEEALAQAEEQKDRLGLVLAAEHWHPGVIGIVASRVVERYYRPVLMLCREQDGNGGHWKGSGRSVSEFDLHEGLSGMEHLFLGFGGHKQAAGLSMPMENLEALREGFHLAVEASLGPVPLKASLKLDRELSFGDISFTLLKELEMLQPFGMGNPEPTFVSPPVLVKDYRVFGKDHVKLQLAEQLPADQVGVRPGAVLPAKAWRKAAELTHEVKGKLLRFAFTPRIDRFDGVPKIELQVKDWDG